jgi:NAD(P)-dependent dehydrogenase (short-subunit alcohol dehydrogenase family)
MSVMLVTGGSRGIGAAIARGAGARGWAVAVNYSRSADKANAVAAEIRKSGGKAMPVQADVSQEQQVLRMFGEIDAELGPVTAVVNNAAIDHPSRIEDFVVADFQRLLGVNIIGPWLCAREGIRRMSTERGGNGGVIINISSISARSGGLPSDVMYATSKGALDSFTLGMAKEVGRCGIRVVGVRPGITRTEIFDNSEGGLERVTEVARRDTVIGRIAEPEEVAELVLWLASPAASYVTATNYEISAGR